MKIPAPNYTQTPNILFDETFKTLKEGELRVIIAITRQTFGWHKSFDRISLSQLSEKTGMERRSVCRSLNSLITKGLVEKRKFGEKGKERCYYALVMEQTEKEEVKEDDGVETEEEMELISNSLYQCPKDTRPVTLGHPTSDLKTPTKETNTKEKEQQHSAAFFSKTSEKENYPIQNRMPCTILYPILKDIDIPLSDKQEISRRYSSEVVEHAIKWALHPSTKINSNLAAALKWACQHQPALPVEKVNLEAANKEYAMRYDTKRMGNTVISALNNSVEFYWGGEKGIRVIKYDEPGFMEQFKNELRKHKYDIY